MVWKRTYKRNADANSHSLKEVIKMAIPFTEEVLKKNMQRQAVWTTRKVIKENRKEHETTRRLIKSLSNTVSSFMLAVSILAGIGTTIFVFLIGHANDWFAKVVRQAGTGLVELEATTDANLVVAKTAGSIGQQWLVAIAAGGTVFVTIVYLASMKRR